MIFLTKLDGKTFMLNETLIETVSETPDTVIVLENGRIVEEGNHEQLMRLGGKYAELFTTQAKHYIESTPADTNEPPFPMKPKTL